MGLHNLEFDTPKHPIEHKIMLLLGVQGYKHKDLRFKDCSDGLSAGRILQHGYWNSIEWDDIMYIQDNCDVRFEIVNWEDEDTGFLTGYRMHY